MSILNNFKPRMYQETIFNSSVNQNTLVVLPTGMGKTSIALMMAAHRLTLYPDKKIMILAPTKPLAEQIMKVFKHHFNFEDNDKEIVLFTGTVKPEKRAAMFKTAKIICSTPQGLVNDIIGQKIDLKQVSLLVFDEAHRAVGDYAYVFIAEQYHKYANYEHILALTASPGSDLEKIDEVIKNLAIEKIELRTDTDHDVKPYIQDVNIKWVGVILDEEFLKVKKYIENCYNEKIAELKALGKIDSTTVQNLNKGTLLKLQGQLHGSLAGGGATSEDYTAISKLAEALKIEHGLELLETQGITALKMYLDKIVEQAKTTKTKAVKNLVVDVNFKSAVIKTNSLFEKGIEHPKLIKLKEIILEELKNNSDAKIIIFNQFRDSANKIVDEINLISGSTAKIFVGQMKKNGQGMSQKEQIKTLDDFRKGQFNILVSTSVGEEGLDIPQVDLVIFYEPIPSAIRTIQRRGRTGRTQKGKIITLMSKGTRDEGYRWSAHHKEKKMYRNLEVLRGKVFNNDELGTVQNPKPPIKKQPTLSDYENEEVILDNDTVISINDIPAKNETKIRISNKVKIFVDDRERNSKTVRELFSKECDIIIRRLKSADYVVSKNVGIEFKNIPDFIDSIIDGRLLGQLKDMKNNFFRPVIIVEGEEDMFSVRKIHPNAIYGMITMITVSYGIPILFTKNPKESCEIIYNIAKREQRDNHDSHFTPHSGKRVMSLRENQEYVVSSLPGIGMNVAKELLKEFSSVKNVFNASTDKLCNVDKIGKIKAEKIREIVDGKYEVKK